MTSGAPVLDDLMNLQNSYLQLLLAVNQITKRPILLGAHTCNDAIVIHFENPESWLVDIRRPSDVDYIRCAGVRYSVMVDSITTIYAYLNKVR